MAICFPSTGFTFHNSIEHITCDFEHEKLWGFNVWLVREFPRYLVCDYCLTIHRDGFILNPNKWEDLFLKYDYVGAPWDRVRNGGNGGFCLFSKKFANWYSRHPFPMENKVPHDNYVCETLMGTAIASGFKYAPLEVCARFSLECHVDGIPRTLADVFGFHGGWWLEYLK